jgi:hypothetical protein
MESISIPQEENEINEDSDEEEWNKTHFAPRFSDFHFYEYGFHGLSDSLGILSSSFRKLGQNIESSLGDLRKSLQDARNSYAHEQMLYNASKQRKVKNPVAKNMFNIAEFQKLNDEKKSNQNLKISQFRTKDPKWDSSFYPDKTLIDSLYRIPCRDPSGKMIFSLSRESRKGLQPWKTPQPDQDIPDPTINHCSKSYQQVILNHMDCIIEKVELEYKNLPESTQTKYQLKAQVGADLNELKRQREMLQLHLTSEGT